MCIRDRTESIVFAVFAAAFIRMFLIEAYVIPTPSMEGTLCLLYTSDAADERSSVDLGGRRIIKKKKREEINTMYTTLITKRRHTDTH